MDLVPSIRNCAAPRLLRRRHKPANLSRKGPVRSRFGTSTLIVDHACALELPDDTQDHLPLAPGQVQALVGYGAYRLVPEDAHRFFIQERRLSHRIEEVSRMHAEHFRQGNHLLHGRVSKFSCPDLLDMFLTQVSQAHAGHFGIRIGFSRRVVLYDFEEAVRLFGEAHVSRDMVDRSPNLEVGTLLEPQFRREVHDFGDGLQFLETGVLDPALPQVGDVRARHDTISRLVDLLAAPPAPIRTTVHLQEALELLRNVHLSLPPPPHSSCGSIYDTIDRIV